MKYRYPRPIATYREEPARARDPLIEIGSLAITGHAVGAVLCVGMFIMVWAGLPDVRPILGGALAAGTIFGFVLWLKRR
jgi:hypothetical protein